MLATIMQAIDTTIANVAATHSGQPLRRAGPDYLGADLLYRRCSDYDPADWLAGWRLRHQARLSNLGYRFYRDLGAVRLCRQPCPDGPLSIATGGMPRCIDAVVTSRVASHQPARTALASHGGMWYRSHGRADRRPRAPPLADR